MNDILVFDTEATIYEKGHPFSASNKLMCVGTLYNGEFEYFDIEHSGLPYNKSIRRLVQLFTRAKLIVGFNIKYDLHWIRLYCNVSTFAPIWDCQLGEFILYNQTNPYPSLDFASRLRGLEPKHNIIATEYWDKGLNTTVVPVEILKDRVLSDVQLTYEVYLDQERKLKERGLYNLFRLQCADTLTLEDMEFNGMMFDTQESIQLGKQVKYELAEINNKFNQITASNDINLNSPKHLSILLYGGLLPYDGIEAFNRTLKDGTVVERFRKTIKYKQFPRLVEPIQGSENVATKDLSDFQLQKKNKGREEERKPLLQRHYSVDEPTLLSLKPTRHAKQIIEVLLKQSELEKLNGTYYEGIPKLIEKMQWEPNTIHGQLNQCVTRTARLSSSKPNLQNFASIIKDLFYPRNDILINVDAKGLEWVCAAFLSQDPVAMKEIIEGLDTHELNRVRFRLDERVIAKIFLFRLIFGGTAYSYAHDPDFTHVSTSEKFWQKIIDETYDKYRGLNRWHNQLVQTVVQDGRITIPTGRVYAFQRTSSGGWPTTQILNYPVQGFGADLMSIIRVSLYKRMRKYGCKSLLVCTVHDSILIDALDNERDLICNTIDLVFKDLNRNYKKLFGSEFNLPLRGEISTGLDWGNMVERVA